MHEVSIVQALCRRVGDVAREHGARRVKAVELEVGALANVVPELLEQAFAQVGELFEGARLNIHRVPLEALCMECKVAFEPYDYTFLCPACGSRKSSIVRGEELLLRGIELEV